MKGSCEMENKLYTKDHLWVCKENDIVTVGISDHAIKKMKAIVFVNLPDEGDMVAEGEAFGDVESLKTVSELVSPVSGIVTAVNSEFIEEPENIQPDSENNWLISVKAEKISESLLEENEYNKLIESE